MGLRSGHRQTRKTLMSAFRAFIRERLLGKNPDWAREWDDLLSGESADAVLRKVAKAGGDPEFCVYLLAEYRWRVLTRLPRSSERKPLLNAVTVLRKVSGGYWER